MPSSPHPQQHQFFAAIRYIIASSLPTSRADELKHVLDTNGAVYLPNGLHDSSLTTVITNSNRFEGWEVVNAQRERVVEVVTDQWVERSLILGRLQPAQYFSPDPSMIFSGVVACACDLPSADLEVLSAGITALGGQWRTGLTKDVTHLFALSPASAKYATAMHFKEETGVRVVLPHWFDDAVRLGMGGLKTRPYEWPDPEILKGVEGKSNSAGKGKGKADVEQDEVKRNMYATAAFFTPTTGHGQSSPPSTLDISTVLNKASPETSGTSQVLQGRKILLSRTLELYKNRHEAVQLGIERAGGAVLRFEGDDDEPEELNDEEKQGGKELSVGERRRRKNEASKVEECDVLVTRWRFGRAYVNACKSRKVVGTLPWLFHVQSTGILSNPQDQLLHYPIPKHPIDNFANHVITVTNYTGEAREYLKKLICTMGAKFTPSMSGQNTVLVAAFIGGTKATKAHSWSIPVVNHTWLEDCFVQWRNLTVALEKYIVFPSGVDFSALLGERGMGVVGNRIEDEAEELAERVFEEDDETFEKEVVDRVVVDGNMDVDGPNGTEDSAKEAVRGLVDEGEDQIPVSARVSTKPHSKRSAQSEDRRLSLKAPDGMDVDFEPPSTAAVVAEMDWKVDFDFEEAEGDTTPLARDLNGGDEDDDDEGERQKKGKGKEAKEKQIAKERRKSEEGSRSVSKTKTSRAKAKVHDEVDELEEEFEEEEELVVVSKKITKSKKSRETDVIELKDSDDKSAKNSNPKGRRNLKKNRIEDLSEDGAEEESPSPSTRAVRSKTSVKVVALKTKSTLKTNQKMRAVSPGEEEEEEEEEEEGHEPPRKTKTRANGVAALPSPPSLKSSRRRPPPAASSKELESEDDEPEPVSRTKLKGGVRKGVNVELMKGAGTGGSRGGKKEVVREDEDEDEDGEGEGQIVKKKGVKKVMEVSTPPKKVEDKVGAGSTAQVKHTGLLNKTKGDARTRIRRKSLKEEKVIVESESEEVEMEMNVPAKASKQVKKRSVLRKEEEDLEDLPRSKTRVETETVPSSKGKEGKRKEKKEVTTQQQRSKPLRVYSSEEDDGEDDGTTDGKPGVEEEDEEEELPAVVYVPSGSRGKAKGNTTKAKEKETERVKSNGKAHVKPSPKSQPTSTPKRTVSVLMPTISGGPKKSGKKVDGGGVEEKAAAKRTVAKLKSKFLTPTSDTEEAEGEGDSPRARLLVKSNSLKTIAGQSSLKALVVHSNEPDSRKKHHDAARVVANTSHKGVSRGYVEVDEETGRSTPGSTLSATLPRRNAAARASQRLHETIMPDLVNFEAQMKKSKGKGRQSGGGGNMNAFTLDHEREVGKRKKVEREEEEEEEEEEVGSDEEHKPKKKRRVSNENEGKIMPKAKTKGKQKANDDDDAEVDNNKPSSDVVLLTTQVALADDVVKSLTKLGVRMTTRPTECTHLLAPHLVRTEKFLCALACAPHILNSKWATSSAAAKRLLPEKDFLLKDEAGEKRYGFKLAQALRRAKANKGKLLEGKTFYVTPKVAVDKKLLKYVVNACGGQVTTQSPSVRIISSNPDTRHVISCKEDISIWRPIAAQGYKIYSQELLLNGVMKQEMEWEQEDYLVES